MYEVHIARYFKVLRSMGYNEDEVVAIDFEGCTMLFYMTSGRIVRVDYPTTPMTCSDEEGPQEGN
jgi:hypothetical protein